MTKDTICIYSEPVWWDKDTQQLLPLADGIADKSFIWNFSKKECSTTDDVFILIENQETGAEFYVDKTLNYGEAMILWFLTLFSFYLIFRITYNFFWKK